MVTWQLLASGPPQMQKPPSLLSFITAALDFRPFFPLWFRSSFMLVGLIYAIITQKEKWLPSEMLYQPLKAVLKEALWHIYLILCISVSLYESLAFMWRKWLNRVKMASRGRRRRGAASLSCAPGDKDMRLLNQHNALSVLDGAAILEHCKACKTEVNISLRMQPHKQNEENLSAQTRFGELMNSLAAVLCHL